MIKLSGKQTLGQLTTGILAESFFIAPNFKICTHYSRDMQTC